MSLWVQTIFLILKRCENINKCYRMIMQNLILNLDIAVFTQNATFYENGLICTKSHKRQENLIFLRMLFFLFKSFLNFLCSFISHFLQQSCSKIMINYYCFLSCWCSCSCCASTKRRLERIAIFHQTFLYFKPRW